MELSRTELLDSIRDLYDPERVQEVDPDFLSFEEDMAKVEDLECLLWYKKEGAKHLPLENPYNSILSYVMVLTDDFDNKKARADTIGGSPPDIDIDFDALKRQQAINWVIEKWGRENVANIITHGSLKPKSLARKYFKITEDKTTAMHDILGKIPDAKFGKEATLEEVIEAHPQLPEKYPEFYDAAEKLENMVANFGVHAGGIVISDFPIWNEIPLWAKKEKELQPNGTFKEVQKWVTQYDMKETESLGLIKFDFLGIDTLSIINSCVDMLSKRDIYLDPYNIPDGDEKAYKMMAAGLLTGVFQMETSGSAKNLITKIKPNSIEELSDISALNRPGPMQAGLDDAYIENRENNFAPDDMPEAVSEIVKDTYWTLVYQEQVMRICSELAGYTLREADDIRRAMGKKDKPVLEANEPKFIQGCLDNGLSEAYARDLWETLIGFADYCLAGDTKIMTRWGPYSGRDTIKSLVDTGKPRQVLTSKGYKDATQFFNKGKKECYTYTFDDGSEVTCTPDHKFLCQDGKMRSIDVILDEGHILEKKF